MAFFVFLIAVAAGLANPFQSATNSELNKQLAQPIWTGLAVYASGFLGLLLIQLFVREPVPSGIMHQTPWWAWLGGLISLLPTIAGLMLTQKLGSGVFTGITITAAILCSTMLDHFGWLGLHRHPATAGRLAGCGLLIAGMWLVAKF